MRWRGHEREGIRENGKERKGQGTIVRERGSKGRTEREGEGREKSCGDMLCSDQAVATCPTKLLCNK